MPETSSNTDSRNDQAPVDPAGSGSSASAESSQAALRLTLDDQQGKTVTADCRVIGVRRLNGGTFAVRCERPGTGGDCPQVEVVIDKNGCLQPQRDGVFALW